MSDNQESNALSRVFFFYGRLTNGKRPRHKPRKRSRDCLNGNLKSGKIDVNEWEGKILDRNNWRRIIKRSFALK